MLACAKEHNPLYEDQPQYHDDGVIEPGHQAAYVRALTMNLCKEEKRPKVAAQLVREIEACGYRLNTGFLSTPFLLPVLYVAGITPLQEAPGYKAFALHPLPGGSLTHAEARYACPFGTIISGWERANGRLLYHCTVPVNTSARLTLPDGRQLNLGSGEYHFEAEYAAEAYETKSENGGKTLC